MYFWQIRNKKFYYDINVVLISILLILYPQRMPTKLPTEHTHKVTHIISIHSGFKRSKSAKNKFLQE